MNNILKKIQSGDVKFIAGIANEQAMFETKLPEILFLGKSNVGKSSLINALFNNVIARTSKNPGCTRQINLFEVAGKFVAADVPGYGYAKVSKSSVNKWGELVYFYIKRRVNLRKAFILLDSRRPVDEQDKMLMSMFSFAGVPLQTIITKMDKIDDNTQSESGIISNFEQEIDKLGKKYISLDRRIIYTSSKSRTGLNEICKEIINFCGIS